MLSIEETLLCLSVYEASGLTYTIQKSSYIL